MSNGPNTTPDGRIQPRAPQNGAAMQQRQTAPKTLAAQINDPGMLAELRRALPRHFPAEKMARVVLTALRTTRDLANCTPESFFGCVMTAAQLGLEVNTPNGHAYLIPRRNGRTGTTECSIIIGYSGMIELALRSGKVEKVIARSVRDGDHFLVRYGLTEDIEHIPSDDPDREERPITYVYAVAKLTTGGSVFEVMSRGQVENRRKSSSAGGSGPWRDHWEAMAKKTVVRALFKWLPKSSEMGLAEGLEQKLDDNTSQSTAFDSFTVEALERQGLQPIDTAGEAVPHDPDTGEVREPPTSA
jgi:recombination protein RecT